LRSELMFQEAMRISVAAVYDRRIVSDNLPSALLERATVLALLPALAQ
jgi:hypothetical protein